MFAVGSSIDVALFALGTIVLGGESEDGDDTYYVIRWTSPSQVTFFRINSANDRLCVGNCRSGFLLVGIGATSSKYLADISFSRSALDSRSEPFLESSVVSRRTPSDATVAKEGETLLTAAHGGEADTLR